MRVKLLAFFILPLSLGVISAHAKPFSELFKSVSSVGSAEMDLDEGEALAPALTEEIPTDSEGLSIEISGQTNEAPEPRKLYPLPDEQGQTLAKQWSDDSQKQAEPTAFQESQQQVQLFTSQMQAGQLSFQKKNMNLATFQKWRNQYVEQLIYLQLPLSISANETVYLRQAARIEASLGVTSRLIPFWDDLGDIELIRKDQTQIDISKLIHSIQNLWQLHQNAFITQEDAGGQLESGRGAFAIIGDQHLPVQISLKGYDVNAVSSAAYSFLKEKLKSRGLEKTQLSLISAPTQVKFSQALHFDHFSVSLIWDPGYPGVAPKECVWVNLTDSKTEQALDRLAFWFSVKAHQQVWVASEDMTQGSKINPTHWRQSLQDITVLDGALPVSTIEPLTNATLNQTVNDGDILTQAMIQDLPDVRKGDRVTLYQVEEKKILKKEAFALEDGSMGSHITVLLGQLQVVAQVIGSRVVKLPQAPVQ